MRYLGIDYGKKRIGVALSDPEGKLAFPHSVLPSDNHALDSLAKIIESEGVKVVIVGESRDYQGRPNKIQKEIDEFVKKLEAREMDFEVYFEPEFMTSAEAALIQGKHKLLDAGAATIILQSYLDKVKNEGHSR